VFLNKISKIGKKLFFGNALIMLLVDVINMKNWTIIKEKSKFLTVRDYRWFKLNEVPNGSSTTDQSTLVIQPPTTSSHVPIVHLIDEQSSSTKNIAKATQVNITQV
jgi:hypothetical protein